VEDNKKIGTINSSLTRLQPGRLSWHLGAQTWKSLFRNSQ
jgi:hypothetical protein